MILWLQDKVEVLEFHSISVHSPTQSFQLPSVVRLKQYVTPYLAANQVKLNRQNIFLRDRFECQYCGGHFSEKRLTIDHVLPLSQGGGHHWLNVVAACSPCNNRKGGKTPEQARMRLKRRPLAPTWLPRKEFYLRAEAPTPWKAYLRSLTRILGGSD